MANAVARTGAQDQPRVDRSDLEFKLLATTVVAIVVIFGLAILRFSTAADAVSVIGAVTGVLGTTVGLFFGAKVGAAGKEKAESDRAVAEKKVSALLAATDPAIGRQVLSQFP